MTSPGHQAEPSLRHSLPRTLATVSPGHLAILANPCKVLSLGTQTWHSWSIQLWQFQALICAIFRHPAVPSLGTQLCCIQGTHLAIALPDTWQYHPWGTGLCHPQASSSAIPSTPGHAIPRHLTMEHPGVAPLHNQLCHPRGT